MLSHGTTKTYFTITYKYNRLLKVTKIDQFMNEMKQIKDFTRPQYSNPAIDMSEFFIENPQYRVIRYVPIAGGIRCWYVIVS